MQIIVSPDAIPYLVKPRTADYIKTELGISEATFRAFDFPKLKGQKQDYYTMLGVYEYMEKNTKGQMTWEDEAKKEFTNVENITMGTLGRMKKGVRYAEVSEQMTTKQQKRSFRGLNKNTPPSSS